MVTAAAVVGGFREVEGVEFIGGEAVEGAVAVGRRRVGEH